MTSFCKFHDGHMTSGGAKCPPELIILLKTETFPFQLGSRCTQYNWVDPLEDCEAFMFQLRCYLQTLDTKAASKPRS